MLIRTQLGRVGIASVAIALLAMPLEGQNTGALTAEQVRRDVARADSIMAAVVAEAAAAEQSAQQGSGAPGRWVDASMAGNFPDQLSATQRARVLSTLNTIASVLRAPAAFNPPRSMELELTRGISYRRLAPGQPWNGDVSVAAEVIARDCATCPTYMIGDHVKLSAYINDPEIVFFAGGDPRSEDVRHFAYVSGPGGRGELWYLMPARVGTLGGFPLYENGVLITRSSRPVVLPVTQEEYIRHLISKQPGSTGLVRELESLTPAQRAAPAYAARHRMEPRPGEVPRPSGLSNGPELPVLTGEDANAPAMVAMFRPRMLVRLNPAVFNTAADKADVQMLFVSLELWRPGLTTHPHVDAAFSAAWKQLDWNRLGALVR